MSLQDRMIRVEELAKIKDALGIGNQYALGDVGDKDDRITEAEAITVALLDQREESVPAEARGGEEHSRRKCIKCGLMIQYGFVPHLGSNGEICNGPCEPARPFSAALAAPVPVDEGEWTFEKACAYVNMDHPAIASLLYDLDLMPEQLISDGKRAQMTLIVAHFVTAERNRRAVPAVSADAEAGRCTQCGEPAVFCDKHAYEMYRPAPADTEGPGLRKATCIVCGETVWWEGTLPPACETHTYGEVFDAIDRKGE